MWEPRAPVQRTRRGRAATEAMLPKKRRRLPTPLSLCVRFEREGLGLSIQKARDNKDSDTVEGVCKPGRLAYTAKMAYIISLQAKLSNSISSAYCFYFPYFHTLSAVDCPLSGRLYVLCIKKHWLLLYTLELPNSITLYSSAEATLWGRPILLRTQPPFSCVTAKNG
jgi:hypothetical protein